MIQHYADIGMAVGDWKCLHCGTFYRFCKRPKFCDQAGCGHKRFEYEELRFESPVTLASCGIDLLLDAGLGKLLLVELKTIEKAGFKELIGVKGEHKLRTSLYLQTVAECAEAGDHRAQSVKTEFGYVMYVALGGWGSIDPIIDTWNIQDGKFSPFKQYVVERDDDLVAPYLARALQYKAWKDGKGLPPRICDTLFDKRAKVCKKSAPCFSGKHD